MSKINFDIDPKPLEPIPDDSLVKKKLEEIPVPDKPELVTKINWKDSIPIIKSFLVNEALILVGGKGINKDMLIRLILLLLIILGILYL